MLTGKTRHRAGFRGKLVLQVQIADRYGSWRDAKIEDMGELSIMPSAIGEYTRPLRPSEIMRRSMAPMPHVNHPASE